MATCSADYTVKIWNPNTNWTLIRTYTRHYNPVYELEWINEDTIASCDTTIQIWSISKGSNQRTLIVGDSVFSLKLLSNGYYLACGTRNGPIYIYDINTDDLISLLRGHTLQVNDLIQINNSTMASSSHDSTVRIWDLNTNTQKFILNGHTHQVLSLKLLSFDILASGGSSDSTIKIWNTTSGELIRNITGHTWWIYRSLDLMNDGQTLVSGSWDKTIKLWNWKTGECLNTINTGLDIGSLATIKTTLTEKTTSK